MIPLLLIFSIIAQVAQQVCRKEYNKITTDGPLGFSLVGVVTTFIYFVLMSRGKTSLPDGSLLYVVFFALTYTSAYVFTIFAIKHGPLSLTSLLISCSVVVPLIYGVTALGEPLTVALLSGIILLFASITFVSEPWKKENAVITPKWVFYITLTFLSNGICVTIQKLFQMKDGGAHTNEFMVVSLAFVCVFVILFALFSERKTLKNILRKRRVIWPVLCGAGNGVANQLTMILAVTLPASFLYPVQSAGGIILTAAVSMLFLMLLYRNVYIKRKCLSVRRLVLFLE